MAWDGGRAGEQRVCDGVTCEEPKREVLVRLFVYVRMFVFECSS